MGVGERKMRERFKDITTEGNGNFHQKSGRDIEVVLICCASAI